MAARFYVPNLNPEERIARLPVDEAHHLVKVLRLGPGETVGVFDGRGNEWQARIETVGQGVVDVSLLEPLPQRRPAVDLTIVQAVLKGDAMDDVVRDCTMVGVSVLQPVVTARTTVKKSLAGAGRDRWRRIALSSAKQCGAARLPEVRDVVAYDGWLDAAAPLQHAYILIEPSLKAGPTTTIRQLASQPVPPSALLAIGPEGGWTGEECRLALAAGCTPLSLGSMTLRAAAVALAAAAALLSIWEG